MATKPTLKELTAQVAERQREALEETQASLKELMAKLKPLDEAGIPSAASAYIARIISTCQVWDSEADGLIAQVTVKE